MPVKNKIEKSEEKKPRRRRTVKAETTPEAEVPVVAPAEEAEEAVSGQGEDREPAREPEQEDRPEVTGILDARTATKEEIGLLMTKTAKREEAAQ